MAFDYFSEDEDQKNQAISSSAAKPIGEESPIVTGSQKVSGSGEPTSSGQFTNLQSYLDANKSLNFGGEVAGRVGRSVDEAESAQSAADSQFRSSVDQGSVKKDQDLIDQAVKYPEAVTGTEVRSSALSEQSENRFAPPAERPPATLSVSSARFTANPGLPKYDSEAAPKAQLQASQAPSFQSGDFDKFVQMRDARYRGPEDFARSDYYSPAWQQTNRALEAAKATKDEAGRKAYLQQEYGSGKGRYDYSAGLQKLDNLLIQNDPDSRPAFANVQNRATQAGQGFDSLKNALDAYAKGSKEETLSARAAARSALGLDDAGNLNPEGGAINEFYNKVNEGYQKELSDKSSEYEEAKKQVGGLQVTPEMGARLGLTGDERIYDIDPLDYLRAAPDPSISQYASPEEHARMVALTKLAGLDNTFLPDTAGAGQYNSASRLNFDLSQLQQAAAAREAAYRDELNRDRFAAGAADGVSNPYGKGSLNDELAYAAYIQNQYDKDPATHGNLDYASNMATIGEINRLKSQLDEQFKAGRYLDLQGNDSPVVLSGIPPKAPPGTTLDIPPPKYDDISSLPGAIGGGAAGGGYFEHPDTPQEGISPGTGMVGGGIAGGNWSAPPDRSGENEGPKMTAVDENWTLPESKASAEFDRYFNLYDEAAKSGDEQSANYHKTRLQEVLDSSYGQYSPDEIAQIMQKYGVAMPQQMAAAKQARMNEIEALFDNYDAARSSNQSYVSGLYRAEIERLLSGDSTKLFTTSDLSGIKARLDSPLDQPAPGEVAPPNMNQDGPLPEIGTEDAERRSLFEAAKSQALGSTLSFSLGQLPAEERTALAPYMPAQVSGGWKINGQPVKTSYVRYPIPGSMIGLPQYKLVVIADGGSMYGVTDQVGSWEQLL